jgi:hypothetical protein
MWSLNKRKNRSLDRHANLQSLANKAKRAKQGEYGQYGLDLGQM